MFSFRTTPFFEQPDLTLQNGRIAVLCNQVAWHPDLGEYLFESIARRMNLVKVFTPEHSFYGPIGLDIPVVEIIDSIPRTELEGIDGLVIELQDVGSRYSNYTRLLYGLCKMMKEDPLPLSIYILDRPNPSGRQIEGTMGEMGLPQRHGLTIGELANMFYSEMNGKFALHIISASAESVNKELMPWTIPPFSDFAGLFTSHFYSGQCLWRGTNVSYGHGTTRPFEQFGAPFMESLADYNERHGYHGWNDPDNPVSSREIYIRWTRFEPAYGIHAGEPCFGFQLMFIPGVNYHALNHELRIIRFLKENCPGFEMEGLPAMLEDDALMCYLRGEVDWDVTREYIKTEEQKWLRKSKKYTLYEEDPWRVK
ncbi:MAG: DUF1343 domain-containing protein [Bacteroidales bacterium]|nr:DUF1343 domain-containing protein [Bacteroidales bacterium]